MSSDTARRPQAFVASAAVVSPDEPLLTDVVVVTEGDRICDIGPSASVLVPDEAEVVDLGDATIVPGLIDAHVHLGFDGSDEPSGVMRNGSDLDLAWLLASNGARQLRAGVTTVRDLGCRDTAASSYRDAVAAGLASGPRVVASDAPVTVTGGHCWYMSEACDDVTSLLQAVRRRSRDGADLVKVMLTGGFLYAQGERPHRPVYDTAELSRLVEEAHALDLSVAAHAHGVEGIRVALEAGVDTIEHCTMTSSAGVSFDHDLAAGIAQAERTVVPTLNDRWLDDDLPWASSEAALGVVAKLHAAGVRLATGTDGGIDGVDHGHVFDALRALVAAGLSDVEAYRAATTNAAAACGLGDLIGRLAVGAYADLVAVRGDPRDNIDVLARPLAVVAAGRRVR